jgi:putative selenate reductase molybdopterin-binding subunit
LMALRTGEPAEVTPSRQEMFTSGPTSWEMLIDIKTGATSDRRVTAQRVRLIQDNGASLNCSADGRVAGSTAVCIYNIPHFHMQTYGVDTNTTPAGSYRRLGCPQVTWAVESQIDILAERLGLDPVAFREKNMLKKRDLDAHGQQTASIGALNCLISVANRIPDSSPTLGEPGPWRGGRGIAVGGKQNGTASSEDFRTQSAPGGFLPMRRSHDF